jgi:hypothetical protein
MNVAGMKAGQIMLVPTARMIDRFIRGLPAGTSMDVRRMRAILAKRHGAEVTCPIYTGFHLRTVAEAAFEAYERGVPLREITPFWRVIDSTTPTARRLACGMAFLRRRRRKERLAP